MKITLLQPSYSSAYGFKKDIGTILPPINLMYLSSYLRSREHDTGIVDLEITEESKLEKILTNSSCNFFGITSVTSTFPEVIRIAQKIKQYDKNNKVIFGGPHATAIGGEVLDICKEIDFVVFGEGEETLNQLLNHFCTGKHSLKDIDGIIYRENNRIRLNRSRELIKNIDTIPFLDHDIIDYNKYKLSPHREFGSPFVVMTTSRGCPYSCTYCGTQTTFGNSVRFRSTENILSEIDFVVNKYNVKNISFWDDTITLKKGRFMDLCKGLKDYDIRWSCNTRADAINLELLSAMKEAGCKFIFYGVESSDENILKKLGRGMSLDRIKKAIKLTKELGMRCTASMMIGTPFDTPNQIEKNIEFLIKLNPDMAFFTPFTAHTGTPIYEYCVDNKIIPKWKDWLSQTFEGVPLNYPVANPLLSREDIQRYLKIAYNKFYSRQEFFEERAKNFTEEWEFKILEALMEKFLTP